MRLILIRIHPTVVTSHLSILGGEVCMHVLVAVGHDFSRPYNAKLMQHVLEDKHGAAINVGLVTGHIFVVFW
jgi:hypothetical protein